MCLKKEICSIFAGCYAVHEIPTIFLVLMCLSSGSSCLGQYIQLTIHIPRSNSYQDVLVRQPLCERFKFFRDGDTFSAPGLTVMAILANTAVSFPFSERHCA